MQNTFVEYLGGHVPAELSEMVARCHTIENDLREFLTAVEPESCRQALNALYELHQEETRLLLAMMRRS